MSGWKCNLWLATAILVAAPLAALSDRGSQDQTDDQRLLEKGRARPDPLAQRRAEADRFVKLPPPRREQLFLLDHDLYALPPASRKRLLVVAHRYYAWLQRLPDADREKILATADPHARVKLIRELRESEWIQRLPARQRENLEKTPPGERAQLVLQMRRVEQQRRQMWRMHFQHWDELLHKQPMPAKLADFPADVQTYVTEYLTQYLGPVEKTQLTAAEGKWPVYPYMLVRLADNHPMALPGNSGPTHFKDLPTELQNKLSAKVKDAGQANMKKAEGKWPDYAITVTNIAHRRGVRLPYELWPSRRSDLSPAVATFLDKNLMPLLSDKEKLQLKNAEARWPLYPRTIQALATQHGLQVPWQTLPGTRERWDSYRARTYRPTTTGPILEAQK